MSAVKAYMSAREIADLSLPDFPTTKRGVQKRLDVEAWPSRNRSGIGGGKEYLLPQWLQIELAMAERRAAKPKKPAPKPSVDQDALTEARTYIVGEIRQLQARTLISRSAAISTITDAYNDGSLPAPDWVRDALTSFTARTATRWFKRAETHGSKGLEDKPRGPQQGDMFERDPNLKAFVISQITARPHLKMSTLRDGISAMEFASTPSLRYLQQWVTNWKQENAAHFLMVTNPDQYRSKYETAQGSKSEGIVRLNQLWEVDGTIFDILCLGADGRPVRYCLTAMVDVFSRRAKVLVSSQPSAVAVGLLIRACILDWGLPERIKADNGKDYTAAYVARIAEDLQIQLDFCTPYNPQEKPHVERFYKTLNHSLAEILPGYVGHNVAERKGIESRRSMAQRHGETISTIETRLDGGETQAVINSWIDNHYHTSEHSALKTAPMLKALQGGDAVRIRDERALDLLLATSPETHGIRTVTKSGVRVHGRRYLAVELGPLVGEKVFVKFDPDDVARVYLYTGDRTEFICVAVDPTLTDIDRKELARRAKHAQRADARRFKAEMKAAQEAHNPDELGPAILASKTRQASKVVQLRPKSMDAEIVTPAFTRERSAASADRPSSPCPAPVEDDLPDLVTEPADIVPMRAPEMITRADGSTRPVFLDDVEFARWMSVQDQPHPEDVEDLLIFVEEGGAPMAVSLKLAGLTPFVQSLSKDPL